VRTSRQAVALVAVPRQITEHHSEKRATFTSGALHPGSRPSPPQAVPRNDPTSASWFRKYPPVILARLVFLQRDKNTSLARIIKNTARALSGGETNKHQSDKKETNSALDGRSRL